MYLKSLTLQNFRSYTKSIFTFNKGTTVIVGPNTAGKTNILESIYFLSHGKSFLAEKDGEIIRFGEDITRVTGEVTQEEEKTKLEVVVTNGALIGRIAPIKKYLVNSIPKRRIDFITNFTVVFFSPSDLALLTDSPSIRRSFLDDILEQVDTSYARSLTVYTKALRQRNALLSLAKETGKRDQSAFDYWDTLLIQHGNFITEKREVLLAFINKEKHDVFPLQTIYDKSVISKDRLLQYKDAETGSGVTLVGPHRDDFSILMNMGKSELREVKLFGSRGQQRLAILQLKLLEISYIEKSQGERPMLLLDDIFSELDANNISLVCEMIHKQQTILTTTHKEFADNSFLQQADVIELGK